MAFPFQKDSKKIVWKIHFRSSRAKVYKFISTDKGRATWWAESAIEKDGKITFEFENSFRWEGKVSARIKNRKFAVNYLGSTVTFNLSSDGKKGTDLILWHKIPKDNPDRPETAAGWVSVLMAMKAAVDYGVDLRNHDAKRAWIFGYCDN